MIRTLGSFLLTIIKRIFYSTLIFIQQRVIRILSRSSTANLAGKRRYIEILLRTAVVLRGFSLYRDTNLSPMEATPQRQRFYEV